MSKHKDHLKSVTIREVNSCFADKNGNIDYVSGEPVDENYGLDLVDAEQVSMKVFEKNIQSILFVQGNNWWIHDTACAGSLQTNDVKEEAQQKAEYLDWWPIEEWYTMANGTHFCVVDTEGEH